MIVTENQLDEWVRGNARDAQGVIVELVWRLVVASCPKPKECRFPLADSIGQHGSDGVLDVGLGFDPFVPEGQSFWEIGTGVDAGKKATLDYREAIKAIPLSVRAISTFVVVTPLSGRRDWQDTWKPESQRAWLKKRLDRKDWKDVKVLDGTSIVAWMHRLPAVEVWFAHKALRLAGQQVDTLENHWRTVSSIGQPPPLTTKLFLTDRDEAKTRLTAVLDGSVSQLKIETHFPSQVADFVAACLADLDEEKRVSALGRCVLVSGVDAWNSLATQNRNLILIADPPIDLSGDSGTTLIQRARNNGHAVVFSSPGTGIPDPASVRLPVPRQENVEAALVAAGYPEERARTLAQKSAGNLGSLLRCLQNLSLLPEWAEGSPAANLAIAVLLGQWDDRRDADRSTVEDVAGKEYGEWVAGIRDVLATPGAPLIRQDAIWRFVSRYEGWYALGPLILDDDLKRLRTAAGKVLTERDPQFDLGRDERHAAAVHGKVMLHSGHLREGLVETLALLGSHPKALTSCSFGSAEGTALMVVHDLLSEADWERWSSLNDVLPLLAEAAPDQFLKALEDGLARDPCPFDRAFAEESDGLFGRNYMTGLLWALETLAWDPDRLGRVAICLADLAARDPGGRTANRPQASLHTIFLPWLPQTCAAVDRRTNAVSSVIREQPEIGWKLIVSLLPELRGFSMGSRKPVWRETIPEDWSAGVSEAEYREQSIAYSHMAVAAALTDLAKLAELVPSAGRLPPPACDQLLEHLESEVVTGMPDDERRLLWEQLVNLVTRHRKFSTAGWALSSETVARFSKAADRIVPKVAGLRYARLFETQEHHLFEESDNYLEQQTTIERRRQEAVAEILASGGPSAILEFVAAVESPWRVGLALGDVADGELDVFVLPKLLSLNERLSQFTGGFIRSRFYSRGLAWVDALDVSAWSVEQITQMLVFLPFQKPIWNRAARLLGPNEVEYWQKTFANSWDASSDLDQAIEKLVECGRPKAAMRCLYRLLSEKQPLDSKQASRVLLAAIPSSEPNLNLDSHEITEIIGAMQNDADADPDDLFRVEWAYLSLLERDQGSTPRTLERRLATEPRFYCAVVRLAFRSRKEDRLETADANAPMAMHGYRLLKGWSVPPGLQLDGSYNGDALARWLTDIRQECSESGHLEVALTILGQVLTKAPADQDGLWIHRGAAAVLNARDADKIREGFRIELFNSRGAYWVDPTGSAERELASKYRGRADAVEAAGFTRLAATLRDMAATYGREADAVVAGARRS